MESHLIGTDLELSKIEGKRRRGPKRIRWLDGIINTRDMSVRKPREIVKGRESWSAAVCGVAMSWTRLLDGITATTRYRNAPPLIPSSVRPPPADPLGELVKQHSGGLIFLPCTHGHLQCDCHLFCQGVPSFAPTLESEYGLLPCFS